MHGQVSHTIGKNLQVCTSELASHREVLEERPLFMLHMLGTGRGMVADLGVGGRRVGGEDEGGWLTSCFVIIYYSQ